MARFEIHEDIRIASSLPVEFYRSAEIFEQLRKKIFPASWQWVGSSDAVKEPGSVFPFRLLEPFLEEPLLISRNISGELNCLSNVCTHRGNLLVNKSGKCTQLRCAYHGRKFSLDGKFESMPGFEGAENFPSPEDHLPQLPIFTFGKFLFTSLRPSIPPVLLFGEVIRRVGHLPFEKFILDSTRSRDYMLEANWALYIDNFLEGLHIPFVHPGLNASMDLSQHRIELFPWSVLQVSIGKSNEPVFDLPADHPDKELQVAAYSFWLFPNTMLVFYPWGLNIKTLHPVSTDKTRVRSLTYIWRPEVLAKQKKLAVENMETEDQVMVQNVQNGIRGELFRQGRYAPVLEKGVHHFHRMLAALIS